MAFGYLWTGLRDEKGMVNTAYCVMNIQKQGRTAIYGLQIEANRKGGDDREFPRSNIDMERTGENIFLRETENWNKEIFRQIKLAGVKERKDSRVAILIAEGEKRSTILVAEGNKQSVILDAEAEKQAAILRAETQKEKMIKEAEGQVQAVLKVQSATAEGLKMIKEAGADKAVLTLKSLEVFAKAADGKATKIIIPSNIQGIAGLTASLINVVKDDPRSQENFSS